MTQLTPEQYNYLLQAIDPKRVQVLRGMSHLEAWDVRRTLTRVFGIGGWDQELLSATVACSSSATKRRKNKEGVEYGEPYEAFTVVYAVTLRLVIKDCHGNVICHFDEGAAGDSINQPSVGDAHDMALKTAISQALKRAAVNLGDQFGLSLYNDGSRDPVVHGTFNRPQAHDAASVATPELPIAEVKPEQTARQEPESAEELRDRACEPNVSVDELRSLYQLAKKLDLAAAMVVTDTGDEAKLGEFLIAKGGEARRRNGTAKQEVPA
jgi:hypothetical protein